MGRGRQKAKNTKVARELKYFSPNTDLEALQREIGTGEGESDQYEDKWADMYDDEDDTEDVEFLLDTGQRTGRGEDCDADEVNAALLPFVEKIS